jgi:antibiotic biosynthesis monooxygenase (ABM) superfamily enzyme
MNDEQRTAVPSASYELRDTSGLPLDVPAGGAGQQRGGGVAGSAPTPVSTQVTMTVPTAKVAQFEGLLREVIAAARGFQGHIGVDVLRPEGGGTYQIMFRYSSRAEHEAFMGSEQRLRLVARINELLDGGSDATVRSVDGWEGWFVKPGYAPPAPPRRWKMAVITLGALYPIVLGLLASLRSFTGGWPLPLGMLLVMGITIPLMTWVIMPQLTTRLGPWLRK